MAAFALAKANCALGAFYRRVRAKHGGPATITATAHKLARIIYKMLRDKVEFIDLGADYYEGKLGHVSFIILNTRPNHSDINLFRFRLNELLGRPCNITAIIVLGGLFVHLVFRLRCNGRKLRLTRGNK